MDLNPAYLSYLFLFLTGLVAGALNVVAGGGSFLTLPMLIFLGLPATVANATNRVGILFQNVGAVWSFNRHRLLEWGNWKVAVATASLGSIGGVWLAVRVPEDTFKQLLAFLMVLLTLFSLWNSRARSEHPNERESAHSHRKWLLPLAFFFIGVYGGFVQAGVGFLILAILTWSGLDLVRGNAVKVLCVLAFSLVSLALFASQNLVDWSYGLVLALGTTLGGLLGVRITILSGHRWIRVFVTLLVLIFAVKLWLDS